MFPKAVVAGLADRMNVIGSGSKVKDKADLLGPLSTWYEVALCPSLDTVSCGHLHRLHSHVVDWLVNRASDSAHLSIFSKTPSVPFTKGYLLSYDFSLIQLKLLFTNSRACLLFNILL